MISMNFLCAIENDETYQYFQSLGAMAMTMYLIYKATDSKVVKKRIHRPYIWKNMTKGISKYADIVYNAGMKLFKGAKRSTRSKILYHHGRNIHSTKKTRRRSQPRTSRTTRRQVISRRNAIFYAMLSVANVSEVQAFNAVADEEVLALISKFKSKDNDMNELRGVPIKTRFDTDSFLLGFDSQASACISNNKAHFKNLKPWTGSSLKGVGTTAIMGIGTLVWDINDDNGQKHKMEIPGSLYVPNISKCLLSPQHVAQACKASDTNRTTLLTGAVDAKFTFGPKGEYSLSIPHSNRTNVPEIRVSTSCRSYHSFAAKVEARSDIYKHEAYCTPCNTSAEINDETVIVSDSEDEEEDREQVQDSKGDDGSEYLEEENLMELVNEDAFATLKEAPDVYASTDKGELLRYHYRFGHMPYNKLQALARAGIIPKRFANVQSPRCAACMFGKLTKRAWRTKGQKKKIFVATKPGQCVSVDQMESTTTGFIAQLKGRITKRRYKYATVFIDHFSDYTYVHLQETITSQDTISAKKAFEAKCRSMNITVLHYHCDNGRFADNAFKQSVQESGQRITYCGVNAHFQNGRAEKKIRDLRESARTQLLHAINRWPGTITIHLWAYALRYASDVHNSMPSTTGLSPLQLFSGTEVNTNIKDFHAFGCPVYALDSDLASGKSIAPWNPRARIGINLGFSPRHARTVYNVLNLNTATVSPQFHVKHDDFFESVSVGAGNSPTKSLWQSVAGFTAPTNPAATVPAAYHTKTPNDASTSQASSITPAAEFSLTPNLQSQRENSEQVDSSSTNNSESTQADNELAPASEPASPALPSFQQHTEQATDPTGDDSTTVRRSTRNRIPTQKLQESVTMGMMTGFPATTDDEAYYDALHEDDYAIQDAMQDPIAFMSNKKGDADTMYYHQAMAAPDKPKFQEAMLKEFHDHVDRKHFIPVAIEKIPLGTKILDAIWSMKRKRDIRTREIIKWKARMNVHGGQQEHGVHYWETYAPVVNWFSIRLLLSQALMHNWYTKQVDFVLAFPQAEPECEMYMRFPRGIHIPGMDNNSHALKLLRNLYGGKAASRIWVRYLSTGLRNIGFKPSMVDECVWYRGDIIFTFYVDDGIIWCPRAEGLDEFMKDIRNNKKTKQKFDIEDRGNVSDYLGINFQRQEDGTIQLSQPQLIEQIIKDVGVSNHRTRPTPAPSTKILHRDLLGKPFKGDFDYRSVVGKLNYLEKGSRPDIAYAVHQCARFSSNPRESHGEAVRNIVKYLNGTRDRGIILNPKLDKSFEVYVDASFSGEWNKDSAENDASTAKSRSGYVISLHGCPIIWHSKLQTQVALSTTEAEYIALSQSLRDTIPIINLLRELKEHGFTDTNPVPKIHCKVFEDNSGALELAKAPKMRPRTKHINIVYHHFRSFVRDGTITIHPVGTLDQTGDTLTKPLDQNLFQRHRKKIMGW